MWYLIVLIPDLFTLTLVCYLLSVSLLIPMEVSSQFDTVKSGWPIVYIEGLQFIISKQDQRCNVSEPLWCSG